MADFRVHPSLYVCPNQGQFCDQRPASRDAPPPTPGHFDKYSPCDSADFAIQRQGVWFGRPCWTPPGFVCSCSTYVLKNGQK